MRLAASGLSERGPVRRPYGLLSLVVNSRPGMGTAHSYGGAGSAPQLRCVGHKSATAQCSATPRDPERIAALSIDGQAHNVTAHKAAYGRVSHRERQISVFRYPFFRDGHTPEFDEALQDRPFRVLETTQQPREEFGVEFLFRLFGTLREGLRPPRHLEPRQP